MDLYCKSCGQQTACHVEPFNPYDYITETSDGIPVRMCPELEFNARTGLYELNEWKYRKILEAYWNLLTKKGD